MESNPHHFYEQLDDDYVEPRKEYTPLNDGENGNSKQTGASQSKPTLPPRNKKEIQATISQVGRYT